MAKKISNQFVKDVIASADIADILSKFISLKKAGKNYKACCPFHNEKTPSFVVNTSKGFFHCFGCHESGDVLSFIRKFNNLNFIEAVEQLAALLGRPVEYENYSKEDELKEQYYKKCLSFLDLSLKYYRWNLVKSAQSQLAISYLKVRGLDGKIAKKFAIGYALDGWQGVCDFAQKANVDRDIVIETGMAIRNGKGHVYDRFRSRIMFPIRDIQGNVLGYGGRTLDGNDAVKYINSPESVVFKKSAVLYGLYEYRQQKKVTQIHDSIVVVEGYMDVVGLAQYGFYGAVATLGTAFTVEHAKILFRESSSVVLCFDGDNAGQTAAIRTIKLILPILDANRKLKILTLPDNKDPDDYIKENGLTNFEEQIEKAKTVSDFLIGFFLHAKNLSQAEDKAEIVENMREFFAEVNQNIYFESIVATIADRIGFSTERLIKLLSKQKQYIPNHAVRKINVSLNNLSLEMRIVAELFANIEVFKKVCKIGDMEFFPTSFGIDVLNKSLKILKDDSSSNIEVVELIQILLDSYPDYHEYFFKLLSFGLENTSLKDDEEIYSQDILNMLNRLSKMSIRARIGMLKQKDILTDAEKMEIKFLLTKLM